MVTLKRLSPEFPIENIHSLAANGNFVKDSGKVERDIDNLGYSDAYVCDCLQNLKANQFNEAINYQNMKGWLDVYKCKWPAPDERFTEPDALYIKLKINRSGTEIVLMSFHREGSM